MAVGSSRPKRPAKEAALTKSVAERLQRGNADMKARVFNRAATAMVVVTLAGAGGIAGQVQAQTPDASNTGAGPRGTPVAPLTNPAEQQAVPSGKPASQATPPAVEQQNRSQTGQPSGAEQAVPSTKPAPEATTQGMKSEMKKSPPK
jgi:hypothetical protein